MGLGNLTWSWVEMCGPGGLVPWYPSKHDIGACFQQLFLIVPALVIFAVLSAYHYGVRSNSRSHRFYRKWIVRGRVLCCLSLALIPLAKGIVIIVYANGMLRPVDILTYGVELLAWFVHAGYVHSLRHRPNVHGPVTVRVLWVLTFVLAIINLRSLLFAKDDLVTTIAFDFGIATVVIQCLYGLTFCTFICQGEPVNYQVQISERTSLFGSYYQGFREDLDVDYLGVAMENNNTISKLLFYWVNPLLSKGAKGGLRSSNDLFDLPPELDTATLSNSLKLKLRTNSRSLLSALHKSFGIEFYSIGILKFFGDMSNFGGPILLNLLIEFIEKDAGESNKGFMFAGGLFLITFLGAFCNVYFTFLSSKLGLKLRSCIIATIYEKTLQIPYSVINSFSVGEVFNFMSTDTERVVNACPSFHTLWSIPLQIAVCFYLLYMQVGISFLAGVAFTVLLIPINKVIAQKLGELSTKMMANKDERVASMHECLKGIQVIKLHVWEHHFLEKITGFRMSELKYLKGRKYLDALCVYFWSTTPVVVSILTIGTYVLLGNPLSAATIFTTMALINMLIAPLNAFPWVLNGVVEAWVSVKRIQRLLDVPQMDFSDYYRPGDSTIQLSRCCFEWDLPRSEPNELAPSVLRDVTFEVKKGDLVAVIGNVGSGKTTLLHAILGEIIKTSGEISVFNWTDGFAYVAQTPWLQRDSLRNNILFRKHYDGSWYKSVLDNCCLTEDLSALHGGDTALVGEGGCTLSGGQRARVALARAVYQDKNIYILDDVLASLDPPVARCVYNKVICGLLKGKTRILCTNNVQLIANADLVIEVDAGRFIRAGKPSEILANDDLGFCDNDSIASYKESRDQTEDAAPRDEEENEFGAVKGRVYNQYISAVGYFLTAFIILALTSMQTSRNVTDYWLSLWVSKNQTATSESDNKRYLIIYVIIAVCNTFFSLIRAFLFAYGGVTAAQVIHEKLLKNIVSSKVTFFDIAPLGRILNRFSSDTYTVDDSLPFIANILFAQIFGLFGSLALTIFGMPWLLLLIAPLIPTYHYLQSSYQTCSRELKRLSSTTLSPLYCHFNESLQGIVTIRAFRSTEIFDEINIRNIESNQRTNFASLALKSWLSLRLEMMGVALVTAVALVAILQHQFDVIEPALVGLTLAYALSITGLLSGVVSSFTETEREFVALERVLQYVDQIEPETNVGHHPPFAWPSQGVIVFDCVYLKYRDFHAPSLNGISFETRSAEKIGVVGRTGAGKSSLITALTRLVPSSSGSIVIDTVNINDLYLPELRSRIAVIPQEPYLFKGTIRSNLDPLSEFQDVELLRVLEKCQILQMVDALGGLGAPVEKDGRNFSQGQRQLLCLTRAVLKNAKIVCIDEATASVDQETDRLIQQTIRSCFRQSTVLTIAHRISTVMNCDRLLVLRDGEVVEFDTPANLASDTKSYFYKLSHNSGL